MILWLVGLIVVAGLVLALNTARHAAGLSTFDDSPEDRAQRLATSWRLLKPEGPGPYPAALLLSGCDGVRDNMDYWARFFVSRGRAALILDSHTPRGLDQLESWRLVCAGQALPGAERAGDIAVALHALARMEEITDDVVVLGASHGGWATMEFVGHAISGQVPPGLTAWPAPPADLLSQVSALITLYPYCGVMNGADAVAWPPQPPLLMVLAENDSIISTDKCLAMAAALRKSGASIRTDVLAGADHGFDQSDRSLLSTLEFDEDLRDQATHSIADFLGDLHTR